MSDGDEADIGAVMARLIACLRVEREARAGLTQAKLAARLEVTASAVATGNQCVNIQLSCT